MKKKKCFFGYLKISKWSLFSYLVFSNVDNFFLEYHFSIKIQDVVQYIFLTELLENKKKTNSLPSEYYKK